MDNFSYKFYKTTSDAWDAMYEAMKAAERSIYWEIYVFVDDDVGERFVNLLSEKARSGVEVKVIIDDFGSASFSDVAERKLTEAGAEIHKFNRIFRDWKFYKFYERLKYRNHRKVLIVDERTVFLGGVNVKAFYKEWDDLYLKIVGRSARSLLRGFAKSYISAGGKRRRVEHLLHPKLELSIPAFLNKFKYIAHSPTEGMILRMKKYYLASLKMARERVNFLSPYYVPSRKFLSHISLAKERGVEVNIFLPFRTDVRILEYLAMAYYEPSIRAGANIYLLPKMHHGKAISVDDKLGMVGSFNLTPRSFSLNEESAVRFSDKEMVSELNELFSELKLAAKKLQIEDLKTNIFDRIKIWFAKKIERFV